MVYFFGECIFFFLRPIFLFLALIYQLVETCFCILIPYVYVKDWLGLHAVSMLLLLTNMINEGTLELLQRLLCSLQLD